MDQPTRATRYETQRVSYHVRLTPEMATRLTKYQERRQTQIGTRMSKNQLIEQLLHAALLSAGEQG